MNIEEFIKENDMELAIQKIILNINEKIEEYKNSKDKQVMAQLTELIKDRDLVYNNDKKTIYKYLKR